MASPVRIVNSNNEAITSDNPLDVREKIDTTNNPIRSDLEGGGKVSVGTTAVAVTFTGSPFYILITADIDNTGKLFVGKSNVASDGSHSLTFLQAGDALAIAYNDTTNSLYVVSDTDGQHFWKGALL